MVRRSALNNPQKLNEFDNTWYRDTIAKGSPAKGMPTWGTVLSPQQISDLIALIDLWRKSPPPDVTPTPSVTSTETTTTTVEVARPSNSGGPGPALGLGGDAAAGEKLFADNCQKCHGEHGQGGIENPGSTDGTIPPLNPIDETMVSADAKVFAYNVDLFIEHGSTPEGTNPKEKMAAWGDEKKLTPQQIAGIIAYIIKLNPAK